MDNGTSTFFDFYSTSDITSSRRILNTPSEFAKDNLLYIQEAGYLKSLKSHISQREQLNSYLFLIVLSGSGQFIYKKNTYKLKTDDCIFIDCNYRYSHQSSQSDPWEMMWVHFNGNYIKPYYDYYNSNVPEVVFNTNLTTDFTNIINNFIQLEKKDITTEFISSKLLTDLLTLCVKRQQSEVKQVNSAKLELIREYIVNGFRDKLALSIIAEEFYISKFYLSREFKKRYGVTIGDYIINKRITYAKELLRFTDKTIEEIALACGVSDNNYFSKIFRKLEGCSCSEYRRKW